MRGLVSFEDVLASLPEERRRKIEAEGAKLLAQIKGRQRNAKFLVRGGLKGRKSLNKKSFEK